MFVLMSPTRTEFRAKFRENEKKFRGNGRILRLGSKFRVPQKTVVPRGCAVIGSSLEPITATAELLVLQIRFTGKVRNRPIPFCATVSPSP